MELVTMAVMNENEVTETFATTLTESAIPVEESQNKTFVQRNPIPVVLVMVAFITFLLVMIRKEKNKGKGKY